MNERDQKGGGIVRADGSYVTTAGVRRERPEDRRPSMRDLERFILIQEHGYTAEHVASEFGVSVTAVLASVRRVRHWQAANTIEELERQEVARLRARDQLRHKTMQDAYGNEDLDVRLRAVEMDNEMVTALTRKAPEIKQQTQINLGDAAAQVSERSYEGRLRKILDRRRQERTVEAEVTSRDESRD